MKRKTKTLLKAIAVLLAAGGVSGFLIFFVNFAHTGK